MATGTRIGERPFFVPVNIKESVDIDYPEDFYLASVLKDFDPNTQQMDFDSFFVEQAAQGAIHKGVDHICFDFDGVLINSLHVMKKSFEYACKVLDLTISFEAYQPHIGKPFIRILEEIGIPEGLRASFKELYDEVSNSSLTEVEVYPGVINALKRLKDNGLRVSLVTSKPAHRTKKLVDAFFPENIFDLVLSPDDIPSGRGKPNPDPLLYACALLGVDPFNSVYVGDMSSDREACVRAGFHFIYANWGYGDILNIKDVWFDNISDLTSYIID